MQDRQGIFSKRTLELYNCNFSFNAFNFQIAGEKIIPQLTKHLALFNSAPKSNLTFLSSSKLGHSPLMKTTFSQIFHGSKNKT